MQIRIKNELALVAIWTAVALIAVILEFPAWLRIILGPPLVLFFPGYCFVAAVVPGRFHMEPLPRILTSIGLSIVLFPLIAVVLHYTSNGITAVSSGVSLSGVIFLCAGLGWWRRLQLPEAGRLVVQFKIPVPAWRSVPHVDRALNSTLVIVGILAAISIGMATLFPRVGERYTEFYLKGPQGSVLEYPRNIRVGTTAAVVVGIVNEEGKSVKYRVEERIAGVRSGDAWTGVLNDGQTMQQTMEFKPAQIGDDQRVDYLLYREDETNPYRNVYFWLNVKRQDEQFSEFYLNEAIRTEDLHPYNVINLSTVVVNQEQQRTKYRLVFWQIQYGTIIEAATFSLEPEGRWQAEVPMALKQGGALTVHYQLYVGDEPQPRQTVRLYLEVSGT